MTFWNLDVEAGVLGSAAYRQEMAERSASAIRRWLSLADLAARLRRRAGRLAGVAPGGYRHPRPRSRRGRGDP